MNKIQHCLSFLFFIFIATLSYGQGTFSGTPAYSNTNRCSGESVELTTTFSMVTANETHTLTWNSVALGGGNVVSVTATTPSDGVTTSNTNGVYTASTLVFGSTVIVKLVISDVTGLNTETFSATFAESGESDVTSNTSGALSVAASPTATIAGIDLAAVCSGNNPVFNATATGHNDITWTFNGTATGYADDKVEDATLQNVTAGGTATMTVASASCGNAVATFEVVVNPNVVVTSNSANYTTDDVGNVTITDIAENVTSATVFSYDFANTTGSEPSATGFTTTTGTMAVNGVSIDWSLTTSVFGTNAGGFTIAKSELTLTDNTANNFSDLQSVTFTANGPCGSDNTTFSYTALPVEFTYFTALAEGKMVELEWETASELNNEVFYIERSTDGINFIEIGAVDGAGTSFELLQYTFTDNTPLNGTNYYRLRQVDFDGAYEYSETVQAEVTVNTPTVSIAPTASLNQVQVILNKTYEKDLDVNIFDALGRNVTNLKLRAGTNLLPIEISKFQSGQYFIKLSNETEVFTKTFFRL